MPKYQGFCNQSVKSCVWVTLCTIKIDVGAFIRELCWWLKYEVGDFSYQHSSK